MFQLVAISALITASRSLPWLSVWHYFPVWWYYPIYWKQIPYETTTMHRIYWSHGITAHVSTPPHEKAGKFANTNSKGNNICVIQIALINIQYKFECEIIPAEHAAKTDRDVLFFALYCDTRTIKQLWQVQWLGAVSVSVSYVTDLAQRGSFVEVIAVW